MRRSLRMMFFLLGLGGWNKDVNLNMGLLLSCGGTGHRWHMQYAPIPSRLWCSCLCLEVWVLCGDFGLQVGDQAGRIFTGEFLEGRYVEGLQQGLDIFSAIICPLGQRI